MSVEGMIVSGVGGFYDVLVEGKTVCCRLRGRFRQKENPVLVGDRVRFTWEDDSMGIIEEIHPRTSQLARPPIANVDMALIVMAAAAPSPDLLMLDRISIHALNQGLMVAVCINKSDLDPVHAQQTAAIYASLFPTVVVSVQDRLGLETLRTIVRDRLVTLAGPSGVGKSSLLNALHPGLSLATDQLSRKSQRGRHTTRTVTLFPIAGGLVADTPGFSRLEMPPAMDPTELTDCFPEFTALAKACRFSGCLHHKEPNCAVKDAVATGCVHRQRYKHYLVFLSELLEKCFH